MEATLRAASELVTGKPADRLEFTEVRAVEGLRETYVAIGEHNIHVGVANGLTNAKILLDKVKAGEPFHVIEVMACPGGCCGGGGQPYPPEGVKVLDPELLRLRASALYSIDSQKNAAKIVRKPGDRGGLQFLPRRPGHRESPRTAAHALSARAARSQMKRSEGVRNGATSQMPPARNAPTIGNKWKRPPSWSWASRSWRRSRSFAREPHSESQLIAVLHKVQAQFGYLSDSHLDAVAQLLQVPAAKVAGVASFYHFFRLEAARQVHDQRLPRHGLLRERGRAGRPASSSTSLASPGARPARTASSRWKAPAASAPAAWPRS